MWHRNPGTKDSRLKDLPFRESQARIEYTQQITLTREIKYHAVSCLEILIHNTATLSPAQWSDKLQNTILFVAQCPKIGSLLYECIYLI